MSEKNYKDLPVARTKEDFEALRASVPTEEGSKNPDLVERLAEDLSTAADKALNEPQADKEKDLDPSITMRAIVVDPEMWLTINLVAAKFAPDEEKATQAIKLAMTMGRGVKVGTASWKGVPIIVHPHAGEYISVGVIKVTPEEKAEVSAKMAEVRAEQELRAIAKSSPAATDTAKA
jgi:hypothetical protein